jgi:hypothetical protein
VKEGQISVCCNNCCILCYVVSSDIFDEDQEKHNYVRSILKKLQRGLDWFRPSRRVIALCLVSLYYAVEKLVVPDELWGATYIDWRIVL